MLDQLQSSDFLGCMHEKFTIHWEGIEPIELELVEVTDLGQSYTPERRQAFSLLFLGPVSRKYLLQSVYRLEHVRMGNLDIFIVPLGLQGERMQYQAIFN